MAKSANCGEEMVSRDGCLVCEGCGAKLILQPAPTAETPAVQEPLNGGKKHIIPRLVALRTVLQNIQQDYNAIANNQKNVKKHQKTIEKETDYIKDNEIKKKIAKNKSYIDSVIADFLMWVFLPIGAGIAGIGVVIYFFVIDKISLPIESTFLWYLAAAGVVLASGIAALIVGFVVGRILDILLNKLHKLIYFMPHGKYSRICNEEDKKIKQHEEVIADCKNLVVYFSVDSVRLKKIIDHKMEVATDTFGDLIHPSDFCNVDYILYLFITRRADTIKEALQLLDEQKRTEQLAQKIQESTAYLNKNLSNAIKNMGDQVQREIGAVNNKLKDANESLKNISDTVGVIEYNQKFYH